MDLFPAPSGTTQTLLLNIFVEVCSVCLDFLDDVGTALTVAIFSEGDRTSDTRQRLCHVVQIVSSLLGIEALVLLHGVDDGTHAVNVHQTPDAVSYTHLTLPTTDVVCV